jgi:hypothetical protein
MALWWLANVCRLVGSFIPSRKTKWIPLSFLPRISKAPPYWQYPFSLNVYLNTPCYLAECFSINLSSLICMAPLLAMTLCLWSAMWVYLCAVAVDVSCIPGLVDIVCFLVLGLWSFFLCMHWCRLEYSVVRLVSLAYSSRLMLNVTIYPLLPEFWSSVIGVGVLGF